ncbi:hypothetical protein [Piscirickettsia salmonis]|uniref:hypothetical protein n=1 Tax=Piscirickettsia salmonis TaxID=1238 RepID=UPI0012BAB9BE|nr:hypothetical protein [Piscirickettsia salmonis]
MDVQNTYRGSDAYEFIDQNSGKTHQQLADLYPVEMSAKTMGVWIKKLGYTRKKRASDTKNVMH